MTFFKHKKCIVFGASGSIGSEFVSQLDQCGADTIVSFSRSDIKHSSKHIYTYQMDLTNETSIQLGATTVADLGPFDVLLVATGCLHNDTVQPEKSLKQLSSHNFETLFKINTIGPALILKYFTPLLHKQAPTLCACLSARVGSISDNYLGGWYAYRASKAALNMVIKSASIECTRFNKDSIVVALHPGTVDSALSKPFSKHVPPEKLFTATYSATALLTVLSSLTSSDTGKFFAWDGKEILF